MEVLNLNLEQPMDVSNCGYSTPKYLMILNEDHVAEDQIANGLHFFVYFMKTSY